MVKVSVRPPQTSGVLERQAWGGLIHQWVLFKPLEEGEVIIVRSDVHHFWLAELQSRTNYIQIERNARKSRLQCQGVGTSKSCERMDLGMQISNFQYFNISSFSFQIFNVPSVSSFSVFHSFMKPGRSCLIGRNRNSHILEIDRRLFAHAHSCWPCRSLWESTAVSVVSIPFGD